MWVLVNIGCIECGVSSGIVGVFTNKAEAEGLAEHMNNTKKWNWREEGQNRYEVFSLPQPDVLNPEYKDSEIT